MTVVFILHIAYIIVDKTSKPQVLCSFSSTVSFTFNAIIILHLALISVERLVAIKFALRYHTIVTNRQAVIASIVVWLWGIAVTLIFPEVLKADGLQAFKEFLRALSPCLDHHHKSLSLPSASTRPYLVFLGGIITGRAYCDYHGIVQLHFYNCLETTKRNSGGRQLAWESRHGA